MGARDHQGHVPAERSASGAGLQVEGQALAILARPELKARATNLEKVPASGAWVIALPMKMGGGAPGPARIVALIAH